MACMDLDELNTAAVGAEPAERASHGAGGVDPPAGGALPQDSHASPDLAAQLAAYAARWPVEADVVAEFVALIDGSDHPYRRERVAGHFTASAWLVDAPGTRVLLTHHRKLGLWLQLGGHADGDTDLPRAALREAEEESGLSGLSIDAQVFDMDRHWIPQHKDVAAHWHYDVRYVVVAGEDEAFVVSDESHALAWRDIATLRDEPDADASLRRMAGKWIARRS